MEHLASIFWILLGVLAGSIDSIAGGGGLITVPVFSILLGPGAVAIGTNKIVATVSTAVALYMYRRAGHVKLRGNLGFASLVGVGAIIGAGCSRFVPPDAYKWLIVGIAPIIMWIVFRREIWIKASIRSDHAHPDRRWLYLAGLACGFYDGIAGPGGGTLMFLCLFVLARMPLLTSLATAKIANFMSASLAMITFASAGQIVWSTGLWMSAGMAVGAVIGSSLAMRNATIFARYALLVVSTLLILRLLWN